ncbi:MAG: hypothetical protein COA78_24825 [Blastopirellula sp.]|nr:MAG: hypothetical protein COA78_24825 [Blastopirellula sp.]
MNYHPITDTEGNMVKPLLGRGRIRQRLIGRIVEILEDPMSPVCGGQTLSAFCNCVVSSSYLERFDDLDSGYTTIRLFQDEEEMHNHSQISQEVTREYLGQQAELFVDLCLIPIEQPLQTT